MTSQRSTRPPARPGEAGSSAHADDRWAPTEPLEDEPVVEHRAGWLERVLSSLFDPDAAT